MARLYSKDLIESYYPNGAPHWDTGLFVDHRVFKSRIRGRSFSFQARLLHAGDRRSQLWRSGFKLSFLVTAGSDDADHQVSSHFSFKKELFLLSITNCYSQRIIQLLGFSWCTWVKAQGAGHCFWFIRWVKCWEGVSLKGSLKISLFIFHMSSRLLFTIYSFSSCPIIRCYKLWINILCRNHSLMTAFVFVSYLYW